MGADLSRTIMGHVDRTVFVRDNLKAIADTGCCLEWDLFGREQSLYVHNLSIDMPSDAKRMDDIAWVIEQGHGDKVVVAQDVCNKNQLIKYGGYGYAYILESILPRMRRRGFTEESIHSILVDNPARVLSFAEPAG